MHKQVAGVLLITCSYAFLRYAGFGGVDPIHIPGFLVNKGVCLAACVALFNAALATVNARMEQFQFWGKSAANFAFVHVLFALALLSKGNYPKFFADDRLSLTGELVLLTGAAAAYCFWRLERNGLQAKLGRHLLSLGSALTATHLFFMGYAGWLQPAKWHGGLPPITLISFCLAVYSLVVFLLVKKDFGADHQEGSIPAQALDQVAE